MIIRLAIPSDAESIGQVRVHAWQSAYVDHMPTEYLAGLDPMANLDGLRAALGLPEPPFLLKVAELDGSVVGFSILGRPRYQADPDTFELWAVNVVPDHWRKGVGRRLVLEALQDASACSASRVDLWCIKGNRPACALYESTGFSLTGAERINCGLTGHPLHEVAYSIAIRKAVE